MASNVKPHVTQAIRAAEGPVFVIPVMVHHTVTYASTESARIVLTTQMDHAQPQSVHQADLQRAQAHAHVELVLFELIQMLHARAAILIVQLVT